LFRIQDQENPEKLQNNISPDIWFENYKLIKRNSSLQISSEADIYIKNKKYHIQTNLI